MPNLTLKYWESYSPQKCKFDTYFLGDSFDLSTTVLKLACHWFQTILVQRIFLKIYEDGFSKNIYKDTCGCHYLNKNLKQKISKNELSVEYDTAFMVEYTKKLGSDLQEDIKKNTVHIVVGKQGSARIVLELQLWNQAI